VIADVNLAETGLDLGMRWIPVAGLVVLAALALVGVPPLPAYHYAAPDDGPAWPWVIAELVVFAVIMAPWFKTYVGTRAVLVAGLVFLAGAPTCLGAIGHAKTMYPRTVDAHGSWVLAAFVWQLAVAIVAGVAWLRRHPRPPRDA